MVLICKTIQKYTSATYVFALAFLLSAPFSSAYAAPLVPCDGITKKCDFDQGITLLNNIIDFGLMLIPFLAAIALMFAGFMYLTSAGDTGKVSKAHEIFTDTVIGIVVALAAWLIIKTILNSFGIDYGSNFYLLGK